jgi:hypothetical protein
MCIEQSRRAMHDSVVKPSQQRPIARLGELQVFQFICDALRAGEQAVLVTGSEHIPARVPEGALDACANASTQILHVRAPLPEPPELQQMIGAAAGIADAREMAPLAMAARLLFADARQTVILAVDDAHTLSDRSLSYLTQMIELLEPDAPALQIVLAAGPALLDTLARPEYDRFRSILCRPGFESFQISLAGSADGASANPRRGEWGRSFGLAQIENDAPVVVSPSRRGPRRRGVYAMLGMAAAGCLATGYLAFPLFTAGPALPPPESAAPSSILSLLAQFGVAQSGGATDSSKKEDGFERPMGLHDGPATSAPTPEAAPPSDEQPAVASHDDRTTPSPNSGASSSPSAVPTQSVAAAPPAPKAETPPEPSSALPRGQQASANKEARATSSPEEVAPSPRRQTIEASAVMAKAAPTAPADSMADVVAGLPELAPVRIILNVPRDKVDRQRLADVKQALARAGLEVAGLVAADARPGPSVGYYFEADREAAAGVSRLLEPLLGAVDPVALRKRGSIPEPGTIEVIVP